MTIAAKPDFVKKAAFRGGVNVHLNKNSNDYWLLCTSGSINDEINRASMTGIDLPAPASYNGTADIRSQFLVALGTETYSGSISFDMTAGAMSLVKELMKARAVAFSVLFAIPEEGASCRLNYCYMQSLALTGSIDGLVTGTLSFVSADEWKHIPPTSATHKDVLAGANYEQPITYWYTGSRAEQNYGGQYYDLRDWSLTVTQETTPVFGNVKGTLPLYIRCGAMKYDLSATTYFDTDDIFSICIGQTTIEINGVAVNRGINYSPGEITSHTHNFSGFLKPSHGSVPGSGNSDIIRIID